MANMEFNVEGKAKNFQTDLSTGTHKITIDEPENLGGHNQGMDPLSALLSSLAGCENAVANFVAKEMDFDLQGISFQVSGNIDSEGMMGNPDVRPYFQTVSVKAKVETSESEERIQELQEKVDARCPVFTTLNAAGVEMNADWSKA
ncbi:osmotically inducible protein C [Marinococcus halophilus]|uniref:Osmotically inducible protein C n=1 Tax=Marinococcus halophilus TaxID=1371 RepID=A0A510Y332_MARHA|nr:OsmC family protein [Marinococcus halophilus]OZT81307.1 osmotically inducible protein C [Marinococcus halophilus]GEK57251.1 hypothetical protein MHA01_01560 [Marinococcus halophilus]